MPLTSVYSPFFRSYLFPLLDRMNGTRIAAILRFLEQSEGFSLQELQELQKAKLEALLEFTREHVPFYSRFWEAAAGERSIDSAYPMLKGLPLVTKDDLRKSDEQFPVEAYRGRVIRSKTSGSTGMPMTFIRSMEQESWFWALRFRIWRWTGYNIGDPYLTINLNPRLACKKKLQDLLFRCCYLTYNADNLNSERIIERLRSKKITHLNGFSSSLFALTRYMHLKGMTNPGVTAITATGDTLFPSYRELIERQFGIGVTDYYGAGGEGMHLASQCEYREQYHVHMENSIVEIITAGRPARPGEIGRIVVTQLDNYAMPLIRYDLGDTAVAGDGKPCRCGRAHSTLQSIQGRVYDIVYAPNGSALLPHFFVVAFKNLQEIHQYQIIQDEEGNIVAKLVAKPNCDQREYERVLKTQIGDATGGSLKVKFAWVPKIPLSGAGKRRLVISKFGNGLREHSPTAIS